MATKAELEKRVADLEAELAQVSVFRRFAETSGQGLAMATLEGEITYVNSTLCHIIEEAKPEDALGKPIPTYYPQELQQRMQDDILPTVMQEGQWTGELAILSTTGKIIPIIENIFVVRDEEGKPLCLATVITNIAKRKQTETLVEAEVAERTREAAVFKAMVETSLDGIFTTDFQQPPYLTYANQATHELFGYDYETQEMVGQPGTNFWPEEDIPFLVDTLLPQVLTGGFRGEVRQKCKDGTIFNASAVVFALRDDKGQPVGLVAAIRDITEQKEKEARLRWFGLAVEQNPDGIAIADADGNVQFANSAWAELHGYNLEEIQGQHLSIFHTEEQTQKEVIPFNERVMQVGFNRDEMGHVKKDGTVFPTMMTVALIRDEEDNPIGLVGMARDITEQKQAEAERERLQQEVIEAQKRAIQELSTPVIPIMERIIVMPLIGSVDSLRARDITRTLLAGINQHRAKVVILDVTGVGIMDTGIVNHLNKTIQAARLKGAKTIVTGISDAVAEAIVDLGIDWGDIETLSDLRTGLITALGSLGVTLSKQ